MRGSDVLRIRKSLKMSQVAFAQLIRVTPLTISRWERDEVPVSDAMALLIELAADKAKKKRK